MASSAQQSLTVLTDEDGVPGSKFEREPEEYTVEQLKRWLKCRGLKLNGKRDKLLKRVSDCLKSGNHHTLDPSIDNGKWFAAKILKESSEIQANFPLNSLPIIPSAGWRVFPSQNIPLLFNYGHVHYYVLESIQNVSNGAEDIEDGLGHMTDKPMKNGRKYLDSGFVHDVMDTVSGDHYFARAHVWPSMRNELPHNVTVVISANSGAILHASCEPCRASSLGRCSHVVAVLFSILDYVQKHGPFLTQPCTSQECSWNKGKKRNKNPRRVSDAKYPGKGKKACLNVIDFDPRPARYRHVNVQHINNFLCNVQAFSQAEGGELTMWETQLKMTYNDYKLDCDRNRVLLEQVSALHENLKPEALMEIPGTQQQSKSEKWFSERWYRLTASKCLSAFKVGRLVVESQATAALEASKFIFSNIWRLESEHFQSYWMRYGLECEPEAILKYENATKTKVFQTGFWVNPNFPFLGCSPDGLVGNDTVIEIKSLKIFKQYSVETVTSSTSPVPKSVLIRQCFKVENGKCVLKHSNSYFYQCQQILLVTGRKYCDFILHAAGGPDSVERIPRDEVLIAKILTYLTALWIRVIAPEIFEMRVPRDLLPFILAEPVDRLDSLKTPLSASPVDGSTLEDPTTCTSLASPDDCLEADMTPELLPTSRVDPATPVSSTLLNDVCETTQTDLHVPSSPSKSKQSFLADSLYTQEEMDAAEALLSVTSNPTSASEQDQKLTSFPWGGLTSNGITLTNTCPLDNWLMIFQALVKSNKVKLQELPESGHTIATALRLIDNDLYADAKLLILQSLPRQQPVVAGTLDLYGNEGDFFLMLLRPYLTSTFTTTCCFNTCPLQVHTVHSFSVILPQPSQQINNNVVMDALDDWLNPPVSHCRRKFPSKPAEGTQFVEDVTIDENGDANTSWHCAGVRVSSPGSMVNLKSFLVFSVDLLSRGGYLKLSNTPFVISLFGNSFKLYGATLWNGGHYVCIFYFKGDWCMYDGLREYRKKGSGIISSPTMFLEPPGFSLSYLVYCV